MVYKYGQKGDDLPVTVLIIGVLFFVFFAGDVFRSPGETPEKSIMNSTIHYCPENYHPIQYKQWSHPIIIISFPFHYSSIYSRGLIIPIFWS